MKVAFVTITEPTSVRAWSGTNHGIFRALSSQEGVEVIPVGPAQRSEVAEQGESAGSPRFDAESPLSVDP